MKTALILIFFVFASCKTQNDRAEILQSDSFSDAEEAKLFPAMEIEHQLIVEKRAEAAKSLGRCKKNHSRSDLVKKITSLRPRSNEFATGILSWYSVAVSCSLFAFTTGLVAEDFVASRVLNQPFGAHTHETISTYSMRGKRFAAQWTPTSTIKKVKALKQLEDEVEKYEKKVDAKRDEVVEKLASNRPFLALYYLGGGLKNILGLTGGAILLMSGSALVSTSLYIEAPVALQKTRKKWLELRRKMQVLEEAKIVKEISQLDNQMKVLIHGYTASLKDFLEIIDGSSKRNSEGNKIYSGLVSEELSPDWDAIPKSKEHFDKFFSYKVMRPIKGDSAKLLNYAHYLIDIAVNSKTNIYHATWRLILPQEVTAGKPREYLLGQAHGDLNDEEFDVTTTTFQTLAYKKIRLSDKPVSEFMPQGVEAFKTLVNIATQSSKSESSPAPESIKQIEKGGQKVWKVQYMPDSVFPPNEQVEEISIEMPRDE